VFELLAVALMVVANRHALNPEPSIFSRSAGHRSVTQKHFSWRYMSLAATPKDADISLAFVFKLLLASD
jgi:hypothetical protein